MEYSIKKSSAPEKMRTGALIVGFFNKAKLTATADSLNQSSDGLIAKILRRESPSGKAGETITINHIPELAADRLILVGLGKEAKLSTKDYLAVLSGAIKAVNATTAKSATYAIDDIEVIDRDTTWQVRQLVEQLEASNYRIEHLKTEPAKAPVLEKLQIISSEKEQAEEGLRLGTAIAEGTRLAKELADLPGNICTPTYLAERATILAKGQKKLKCKILEEKDMEALGMGSLLSVSKGSREPAKLITLEYKGCDSKEAPHVLVGKGLTFDAGGISLKPALGMDEMKYDMCGGASVLGAIAAAVELQLPINIVGLIPASENLPDGQANKPGDVVTSMSGKTIEILNTDAEGRLILCDTLTYAERYNPASVIDIATLTGACIIALGRVPSGLMGNDESLIKEIEAASETAQDKVWQLPLWDEYQDLLNSDFADIANIGGRDGGSITAGCFLKRFTEAYKWAHLDIAGTAWRTGSNKGATGRPVPLLVQYLIDRSA